MRFIVFILLFTAACVPKPEEIKGCGSGLEFNETTKSCVTIASIAPDSTLTTLTATEDTPESFSLPNATTDSIEGTLYWFIVDAPTKGTLTDCANLDVAGELTSTGTVLRSCVYTSDANYVGPDSFSYKICSTPSGNQRCTDTVSVAVTVEDDLADIPSVGGPALLNINEGSSFNYDIRVSRRTKNEADAFYLCVDIIDPDGALNTPGVTNVNEPGDPIAINDATCSLLGTENDNLASVMATMSSGTNLLPGTASKTAYIMTRLCESATCPVTGIDGLDNDGDLEFDEEDEWATAPELALVSVARTRVNVNDLSFAPTMRTGVLPGTPPGSPVTLPVSLGTVPEDSIVLATIGTDDGVGVNDYVLEPYAYDGDGDAITYEYVPLSLFPVHAGTLLCANGTELACTFDPAVDFSGTVSFRYRARDATNKVSNEVTATLTFTVINDVPVFLASQVLDYDTATPATQVFLEENRTLANRTFRVGEGGGITENSQSLYLRASSDFPAVLAASGITVRRNGVSLGLLSATSDIRIDAPAEDADSATYTLSFRPEPGVVTDVPVTITLFLSDGIDTTLQNITFLGVKNIDDPIDGSGPSTFGMRSGGATKNLEFFVHPGINDWANVTDGNQDLTISVTSSNTAVINLLDPIIQLSSSGGATVITKVGAGCTAASCVFTVDLDNTIDPTADAYALSLVSGIRGNSTLTFTFSDGVSAPVTRNVVVGSYSFAVTFNGWGFTRAGGQKTNIAGTVSDSAYILPSWQALTVTEGGIATSAYKVLVYRKATSDFSTYPADALVNAGVASSVREQTFRSTTTYDDGASVVPGERYYLALAVVPNVLSGEVLYPSASPDGVLEVVVPADNMVMVHRWAANESFCNATAQTADRANNYRCRNVGLGGVLDGGVWYHDVEKHLFVDHYESGCPYQIIEDARLAVAGAGNLGQVHYERNTGSCTYSDGTSWLPFTAAAYVLGPNISVSRVGLPPLVNLTRTEAQGVCVGEVPQCAGAACPAGTWGGLDRELPTRRESLRANLWPQYNPALTALTIAIVEDSGDHTVGVRACNTGNAAGYTRRSLVSLPSLQDDTAPGSAVSSVRSLLNSAIGTSNCVSLFETYNMVGNVAEWLADSFDCSETDLTHASCEMLTPVGGASDASLAGSNSLGVTYSFDGTLRNGPLLEKNTVLSLSNLFRSGLDRIHFALSFPFIEDGTVPHPSLGLQRVGIAGPSSISINGFGNDTYRLAWNGDTVDAATQYAMVNGGDWSNGIGAGRRRFELLQDGQPNEKVGQRCVIRMDPVP